MTIEDLVLEYLGQITDEEIEKYHDDVDEMLAFRATRIKMANRGQFPPRTDHDFEIEFEIYNHERKVRFDARRGGKMAGVGGFGNPRDQLPQHRGRGD